MREYNIYFSFNSKIEYKDILELINTYTENFSIIDVVGYYKGISENSKCLRIISNKLKNIENMIESIKILGNQECVLLTTCKIKSKLI